MKCFRCGHANPERARFCLECGTPVTHGCASCGTELPSGAKFCLECGTAVAGATPGKSTAAAPERVPLSYTPRHLADKILQSRSALEGERKQVTVLFADVKGSMELAEQLDPEEWHKILERFFAILTEGVHRFEGTVNQYTGDGIMALFGAPIAHEDHAQRACYAALALRDAVRGYANEVRIAHGIPFGVRIGLNSGEVVVGRIGDDLRMDYTAQGHTVGLAQRMEALAESGHICLSEQTARLVDGYFRLVDLGRIKIKGAGEPVGVFDLEGVGPLRTRFDRSRARGLSKFAGRTNEMATLDAALAHALAGHGQVIGIVADAGTGKSRLCFEFAESCRAKGIRVRSTTGVAHGKAVPLLPVLDFYRDTFGITPLDDARAAQQKIAGAVVRDDDTLVASLPLVYDFLGVPDPEKPVLQEPGPERQRALLAVLKRLMLARSRRAPAVILFEDLHWIDEATEVFLENLVDATDGSRTLLVVNFRPEYRADWTRRSYYQQLALTPLDARAFGEMLGETLGSDPSLGDLLPRIHARSGGNPFFAEEIVQSLIESGALTGAAGAYRLARDAAALQIPATVKLVLAARIDRLNEREKNVLQTAAVIGRDFDLALLRKVAGLEPHALGDALRALVQAEFLLETAIYPEAEYQFKHPLTQEVAQDSQLRDRRARVHLAVAKALIELHGNDLDEQAALLAHHFESAGDAAEAIRWHQRAAQWLEGRNSYAARRHWERLLDLVGDEPDSPEQARTALLACGQLMWLAISLGVDFAQATELYRRGRLLAAGLDAPDLEAQLVAFYNTVANFSGNISIAVELAEEALHLATRATDPLTFAQLIAGAGTTYSGLGRAAEGLTHVEAALATDLVTESTPIPLARLLTIKGAILIRLGRLAQARSALDHAADIFAVHPQFALRFAAATEAFRDSELAERGFPEGSLERFARFVARWDDVDLSNGRVGARFHLAQAHLFARRPDAALEAIENGIAIANEARVGQGYFVGQFEMLRARALLARGENAAARAIVEASILVSEQNPIVRIARLLTFAEVLIAVDAHGERARIDASLAEVADIAGRSGNVGRVADACMQRAHLARAVGDEVGWERELREALRIYTQMDATGWMERIEQELAS